MAWLLVFFSRSGMAALNTRLTQGGLYIGHVEPESEVFYQGESVRVARDGRFVLGFGRDALLQDHYQVVNKQGIVKTVALELEPRVYEVQRINGVA